MGPEMKVRNAGAVVLAVVLLAVVGCTTLQVGSDYDRSASFSGLHTFAVMKREHHGPSGMHNPLVTQRTEDAIEAELQRKGFMLTNDPGSADFTVDFTIGSRERTDVSTYPDPYVVWGWGRRGWWGGPYWGQDVDVRQYREGTLSIDIFDAHNHRPVWHGWAKKELSRKDIEQSEEPIRKAVASVLERFPPA
jgi:hypothetical protein